MGRLTHEFNTRLIIGLTPRQRPDPPKTTSPAKTANLPREADSIPLDAAHPALFSDAVQIGTDWPSTPETKPPACVPFGQNAKTAHSGFVHRLVEGPLKTTSVTKKGCIIEMDTLPECSQPTERRTKHQPEAKTRVQKTEKSKSPKKTCRKRQTITLSGPQLHSIFEQNQ